MMAHAAPTDDKLVPSLMFLELSHPRPDPTDDPRPEVDRRARLVGGLALLLLVSLVIQLPALRAASEVGVPGRNGQTPTRLVVQPGLIAQVRVSQGEDRSLGQRVQPSARLLCSASAATSPVWDSAKDRLTPRARLAFWYLDLPPPLRAC